MKLRIACIKEPRFSSARGDQALLQAVDEQLRRYLGSPDHRARMARFGITCTEIDAALARL